jgi:hypothetical protein
MIQNTHFKVAEIEDIPGVLALQDLYLVSNLSDEEKKEGFVTTPFSVEQLTEVIRQEGLFLAIDNGCIVAYIFGASWEFFSQWPIFNYMTSLFPELSFKNFEITTTNSFQYGPICIAKKYRGQGLIQPFFEFMRIHLLKKYPLSITFINTTNMPSQKAHINKLKWEVITEFPFNNNTYLALAYDMKVPVMV